MVRIALFTRYLSFSFTFRCNATNINHSLRFDFICHWLWVCAVYFVGMFLLLSILITVKFVETCHNLFLRKKITIIMLSALTSSTKWNIRKKQRQQQQPHINLDNEKKKTRYIVNNNFQLESKCSCIRRRNTIQLFMAFGKFLAQKYSIQKTPAFTIELSLNLDWWAFQMNMERIRDRLIEWKTISIRSNVVKNDGEMEFWKILPRKNNQNRCK